VMQLCRSNHLGNPLYQVDSDTHHRTHGYILPIPLHVFRHCEFHFHTPCTFSSVVKYDEWRWHSGRAFWATSFSGTNEAAPWR
jgi:hypothetical protein